VLGLAKLRRLEEECELFKVDSEGDGEDNVACVFQER
jgi:hypothetical protein